MTTYHTKELNIENFLEARETRVAFQNRLLSTLNLPLLIIRANTPGADKNVFPSKEITDIISSEVNEQYKKDIKFTTSNTTLEGKIYFFLINDDVKKIKENAIAIEEHHPLGRFVDIDVYDINGHSLSRKDFSLPPRKCFLCNEPAVICTRNMTHSHSQLQEHIIKKYERYLRAQEERKELSYKIADIAVKACLLEVSCSPSFGLVSPITNGAHKDMDYFTFVESSFAIKNGFREMAYLAFSHLDIHEIFKRSREIGIQTERDMFRATNNVNTHKGMIFLLGIIIISTAKTLYSKANFQDIQVAAMDMCKDILKDFDEIPNKVTEGKSLTNGEKLYLKHGFLGIRGEAKKGFNILFTTALPFFEKELNRSRKINSAMVKTLLLLMSTVEDTTIVNRKGVHILKYVQKEAENLLKLGPPTKDALELERKYSCYGISPGGSADLLSATIFLFFL